MSALIEKDKKTKEQAQKMLKNIQNTNSTCGMLSVLLFFLFVRVVLNQLTVPMFGIAFARVSQFKYDTVYCHQCKLRKEMSNIRLQAKQ